MSNPALSAPAWRGLGKRLPSRSQPVPVAEVLPSHAGDATWPPSLPVRSGISVGARHGQIRSAENAAGKGGNCAWCNDLALASCGVCLLTGRIVLAVGWVAWG